MGQILGQDIIATPSHSAGIITLPASLLLLGGRQYRTSTLTRTISTDVTMVANTLYFVYAQLVTGVPVLRISASVPSTYKISNPTASLVTAFYANGLASVSFGSFVNISGVPRSLEIQQEPLTLRGSGSNPTKPAHSVDYAQWERDGADMIYKYGFQAAAASSGGAGVSLWDIPTNFIIDFSRINNVGTANFTSDQIGTGRWGNATIAYDGFMYCATTTQLAMGAWQTGSASQINWNTGPTIVVSTSAFYGGFNVILPITGWNKTPLKDL